MQETLPRTCFGVKLTCLTSRRIESSPLGSDSTKCWETNRCVSRAFPRRIAKPFYGVAPSCESRIVGGYLQSSDGDLPKDRQADPSD